MTRLRCPRCIFNRFTELFEIVGAMNFAGWVFFCATKNNAKMAWWEGLFTFYVDVLASDHYSVTYEMNNLISVMILTGMLFIFVFIFYLLMHVLIWCGCLHCWHLIQNKLFLQVHRKAWQCLDICCGVFAILIFSVMLNYLMMFSLLPLFVGIPLIMSLFCLALLHHNRVRGGSDKPGAENFVKLQEEPIELQEKEHPTEEQGDDEEDKQNDESVLYQSNVNKEASVFDAIGSYPWRVFQGAKKRWWLLLILFVVIGALSFAGPLVSCNMCVSYYPHEGTSSFTRRILRKEQYCSTL